MGAKGISQNKLYSILTALLVSSAFIYALIIQVNRDLPHIICILRIHPSEKVNYNSFSPAAFDAKCHKTEYNNLIGKKLSYLPSNAGVYLGEMPEKNPKAGTYIKIDKNKKVLEVICLNDKG